MIVVAQMAVVMVMVMVAEEVAVATGRISGGKGGRVGAGGRFGAGHLCIGKRRDNGVGIIDLRHCQSQRIRGSQRVVRLRRHGQGPGSDEWEMHDRYTVLVSPPRRSF